MINANKESTFTIAIPAYNAEKYLADCLNSLVCQTYQNFDVVLVDDGSTDNTKEIYNDFLQSPLRLKIHKKENQGLIMARRDLIKMATGDYVFFVDADDALHPEALEKLKDVIDNYSPDLILTSYSTNSDFSNQIDENSISPGFFDNDDFLLIKKSICEGHITDYSGKAIRRKNIDADGDYSQYQGLMHGEDLLQILPVINNSSSAYYLNEPLTFYRRHEDSSTMSFSKNQITDIGKVLEVLAKYGALWNMSYLVLKGAILHYCFLTRIVVRDSGLTKIQRYEILDTIRDRMMSYGEKEIRLLPLRVDHKILANSILTRKYSLAELIVKAKLVAEKLIGAEV